MADGVCLDERGVRRVGISGYYGPSPAKWKLKGSNPYNFLKAFSQELESRGFGKSRQGGTGKMMFNGISVVREDTSEKYWNQ